MSELYSGFILPVWRWKTPALSIPEQSSENFNISKRKVDAGTAWPMGGTLGYDYCVFMEEATLTVLQERVGEKWNCWMVDSPFEWYAMGEYAMRAMPPNVLVGGLGLGLILNHLTLRRDLENVTIIEKSRDVIQMVSPYVPLEKVEIIHGDFLDVIPQLASERRVFNSVIVDIWAGEVREWAEDFRKAARLLREHYPNAVKLFHPIQKIVDREIFAEHVGNVAKPIRFTPKL